MRKLESSEMTEEETLSIPITRRAVFAGLGLLILSPPLPEVAFSEPRIAYDQWVTGNTSQIGGCTELSQYYVESKVYPNRQRKLKVRIKMSHTWAGTYFCWTTYEKFYDNGKYLGEYGPNHSYAYGPATLYNPNENGLSLMVTGGGSHHITSKSFEFRGGTVTGNAFNFTIVLPYLIKASAGAGGSITSAGDTYVDPGGSKKYTAKPNTGYRVASLVVDGKDQGARGSYTFSNVQADHSIKVTFAKIVYTVTFKEGYGDNGTLKTEKVPHGGDATAPEAPSRPGWAFKGWDRGYKNVTSNITVTALWEPAAVVRYHADGELRHTQAGLTPGTELSVPGAAVDACRRPGCTPGWRGWFLDSACSKAWTGGTVPAGTLDLYSYNELTVGFAPTTDCAPLDGTFRVEPSPGAQTAVMVPSPVKSRWGRELALSLPAACYRDDGGGHWATMRPQGYFGDEAGGGKPTSRVSPRRDATLFIRWVETVADGVESMRS